MLIFESAFCLQMSQINLNVLCVTVSFDRSHLQTTDSRIMVSIIFLKKKHKSRRLQCL